MIGRVKADCEANLLGRSSQTAPSWQLGLRAELSARSGAADQPAARSVVPGDALFDIGPSLVGWHASCFDGAPDLPVGPNHPSPPALAGLQYAIDRRSADLEGLRDLKGSFSFCLRCTHLGGVYRSRPALVDARGLGPDDPLS